MEACIFKDLEAPIKPIDEGYDYYSVMKWKDIDCNKHCTLTIMNTKNTLILNVSKFYGILNDGQWKVKQEGKGII